MRFIYELWRMRKNLQCRERERNFAGEERERKKERIGGKLDDHGSKRQFYFMLDAFSFLRSIESVPKSTMSK